MRPDPVVNPDTALVAVHQPGFVQDLHVIGWTAHRLCGLAVAGCVVSSGRSMSATSRLVTQVAALTCGDYPFSMPFGVIKM
jgi:hypothetical protein